MPRKRAVPEYISHMIMAKEYTSAAFVSFPSFSSSGAQYDTVPAHMRRRITHKHTPKGLRWMTLRPGHV